MKYYKSDEIDILTEQTAYTLDNLLNLLGSVYILNQNNILISDMHTDNVIQSKESMTIIDTDLYRINRFFSQHSLERHNINALKYLFETLYIEALKKYHPEYNNEVTISTIKNMFNLYNNQSFDYLISTLSKYKFPIEYIIKKKVR